MKLGNAVWSAWKSVGDATRLCLVTATAAFGVALGGAIYNQIFNGRFASWGMFYVGLAYLALALVQGTWQARRASAKPTPPPHHLGMPPPAHCQQQASFHCPADHMVEQKHS